MTAMIDFQETMLIFFTIFHFFAMSSVCSNPIMLVAITHIIHKCSGENLIKDNQEKTPFKKCPCLDGGRTMNQIFFSYQMNQA